MSDFDKEAEREKLRKKFADDEEKRAGTRRMSELLLKGATMTNKHCGRCSDPLFRYDGQTFCPSCQADGAVQDEPQPQGDQAAESGTGTISEAQPETGAESPQSESPPVETESRTPPTPGDTEPTQSPQPQREAAQPQRGQPPQPPETASSVGDQQQKTRTQVGDLTDARQSLQRTVTRFAQAAEQTDDPRRARELLAAAREAAATLSELD